MWRGPFWSVTLNPNLRHSVTSQIRFVTSQNHFVTTQNRNRATLNQEKPIVLDKLIKFLTLIVLAQSVTIGSTDLLDFLLHIVVGGFSLVLIGGAILFFIL
jgi:hypothetical protein